MTGDKLRFRFSKTGDLRFLSHLDLTRCLERMLRRAAVPFRSTAGFHPTPRSVIALAIPLGVAGRDEVLELELLEPRSAADTLAGLNAVAPDGLRFTRATVVPMNATAVPRRVVYRLPLPPDRVAAAADACAELMAADKVWVERTRPTPKRLNIRPYFRRLHADDSGLSLDLWVTGTGTARADELVARLGLAGVVDAGAVMERELLELRDEAPPGAAGDEPPAGPAESEPLRGVAVGAAGPDTNQPAAASWGASPNGPVVE